MKIHIITTSNKLSNWNNQAIQQFISRISQWHIEVIEFKPSNKNLVNERVNIEAKNISKYLQNLNKYLNICLDEQGKSLSSIEFSNKLNTWQQEYTNICFILGSADGIDKQFKQSANFLISLSAMTLPHGLARLILIEQIYRAWSILNSHPYHK